MAHQFPAHQPHVAQMPPQQQNMGQPRQGPMAQQQMPAMGQQQRGMQGQHPLHNAHVRYDPQFALFTFERQKGAEGWEDVEAEQQHVNVQDLQNDVKKFQRNKNTVSRVMEEIPSTNARRLINELVEEQNVDLMAKNRTLRWTIASINIKWTMIGRNKRQLKRISVILQTGPSGYEDPHAVRAAATGVGAKAQPMQPNPGLGHQVNHPAHDVSQQPRNPPPQPQMGHVQQPPQQMRPPPAHAQPAHGQAPPPPAHAQPARGQVPPPPPPPPGMGNPQPPPPVPGPFEHLPPPPPNGGHGMARPAPHGQHQPRTMPGAFPEVMHRPAMRQGQPPIEVLDSNYLRKQKKSKGHHDESSSESDSDSDDWVSESGDSMPDRFRGHKVEHGEFVHIGKPEHGRPRQSSRSRKSRHNKSHSKGRSRSRSRSHVRTETYRRRRDSDYIDPPPMGKHSPMSSKDSSPHSSKQQLPPIHIHVNEKPTRANERVRRDSHTPSSPDYRKDKFGGEPLSRSSSWDRHSGTASFNDNSSIHTADDSVFSEPNRHHRKSYQSDIIDHSPKLRSRALPPRENYGQPHPSHIYGDVEPRPRRSAYPANDYPQVLRQREPYYDEHAFTPRPGVHRRNSAQIQTPGGNPFDTGRFPPQPRLNRASTYAPEMHEPMYAHHEPRYSSDRPTNDALRLDALQDEIEQLKERGRRPLHGRRASEYERMGSYGGYDRHERYGYGM